MRRVNDNNFDTRFNREENPWDSSFKRPEVDAPVCVKSPITSSPIVRVLAIVLIVVVVLYFLYAVCVHPIYKLNLRLLFAKHCVIKVIARSYSNGIYQARTLIIYIDEDAFAIGSSYPAEKEHLDYYKMINGVLHEYNKATGEWQETYDDAGTDTLFSADMFDRNNYTRVKGKLFLWQYKDDDIYFKRGFGSFKFIYEYTYGEVTVEFKRIGMRHLDLPWEE